MEKITVKHFTTGEKQDIVSVLECETEKELLHLLKVLGSEYTIPYSLALVAVSFWVVCALAPIIVRAEANMMKIRFITVYVQIVL